MQQIGAAACGGGQSADRFASPARSLALKYAAALLLLLPARAVLVFALRHLLLADLPHEIKEDLRAEERTLEMSGGTLTSQLTTNQHGSVQLDHNHDIKANKFRFRSNKSALGCYLVHVGPGLG